MKTACDAGLTWFEVDTYSETVDPEGILSFVNIGDGTSYIEVDLSSSRYAYLLCELVLSGAPTAAEAGGIYIPVG